MIRPRSLMVDIETLGTSKRSVLMSIGAVAFDDDGFLNDYEKTNPTVWYGQVPWRDPVQYSIGRKIDKDTLEWWSHQGKALRILQSPEFHELEFQYDECPSMLHAFCDFVKAELRNGGKIMSKGIDFDLAIIETACEDFSYPVPWRYNQTRCLRGYIDAAVAAGVSPHLHMGVFGGNDLKHHAAEDAIFQTKVFIRYSHELWKIRHKGAQQTLDLGGAPVLSSAP